MAGEGAVAGEGVSMGHNSWGQAGLEKSKHKIEFIRR